MKNFGKIKNIFNTMLAESMTQKNGTKRSLFKKYVALLKEDEILNTQFNVYTAIEDMIEENEFKATEKIKAHISLLDSVDRKAITESNNKLFQLTKGIDIGKTYLEEKLHENITNLIFREDVNSFVDTLMETVEMVKGHVINESSEDVIPTSLLSSIAVGKYNDKYETLDENQRKLVRTIIESNKEDKAELFKVSIDECVELIDSKLGSAESTLKETLMATKDNLLGRKFDDESFVNDITKIFDLKEDLR